MTAFIQLLREGAHYRYNGSNDVGITILGNFLSSDVELDVTFYKDWTLNDAYQAAEGNITNLEKDNDYIYLSDLFSQEKVPTILRMTTKQFIQILDDWDTKVCKVRPKEVIIKYHNDQFSIEKL